MKRADILAHIQQNVERLSDAGESAYPYIPLHQKPSPSITALKEVMLLVRNVLFPGFFGEAGEARRSTMSYYTGVHLEQLYDLLQEQTTMDSVSTQRPPEKPKPAPMRLP